MATYAIGDIQGCYDELMALLQLIEFNPNKDALWLTGDLVNRGPKSLEVLRFLKALPKSKIVLGNHDLHLLAVVYGDIRAKPKDTFHDILEAPDKWELCDWLRQQPLLYANKEFDYVMVHAGLAPQWDLNTAKNCANEVADFLQSENFHALFTHMYGNDPSVWSDDLTGFDRLRFIINCFTRLRFCDTSGHINLSAKGKPGSQAKNLVPWFETPNRASASLKIIFGHWAALEGNASVKTVFPLDTGCVWGKCLTAMRIEDGVRFSSPCPGYDHLK